MVLFSASGTHKMILASQSISFQALFLFKKIKYRPNTKKKMLGHNSHPIRIHEAQF